MAPITKNLAVLGTRRYAQSGLITASSQQAGMEAVYLTDLRQWYPWRSQEGALSAVDITFDLGAAKDVSALSLVGCNLTLEAECRAWLSNDPTFSVNLWDSGQVPAFDTSLPTLTPTGTSWSQPWGRNLTALRTEGNVNARYGRLRLWDTSNPDNYLRAAIGLMEDVWQPLRNYQTAYTAPDRLTGEPGVQQVLRGFNCTLHRLEEGEETQILSLTRALKTIGRLLLIPTPLKPQRWLSRNIWGVFSGAAEIQGVDQGGRFSSYQLQFIEVDE